MELYCISDYKRVAFGIRYDWDCGSKELEIDFLFWSITWEIC